MWARPRCPRKGSRVPLGRRVEWCTLESLFSCHGPIIYAPLSLLFFLSLCVSLPVSLSLSFFFLSLSLCLSACLCVCLSVCLSRSLFPAVCTARESSGKEVPGKFFRDEKQLCERGKALRHVCVKGLQANVSLLVLVSGRLSSVSEWWA